MSAEASELEVSQAMEKLVDAGVIARGQSGHFFAAFPDLGEPNVLPALRNLTRKYGRLEGKEAVVLSVIPPALCTQPLSLGEATLIVNAAIASMPRRERRHVLGF